MGSCAKCAFLSFCADSVAHKVATARRKIFIHPWRQDDHLHHQDPAQYMNVLEAGGCLGMDPCICWTYL